MAKADLTLERLKEELYYDPHTGVFLRRVKSSNRIKAGAIAGCIRPDGYRQIMVLGVCRYAHRLAWLWVTGENPIYTIDHIDGDRGNNRFTNLRDIPQGCQSQNLKTARRDNISAGLLGVTKHACGKFMAQISVHKEHKYLGLFDTAQEAHDAYLIAKRSLHDHGTL